MMRPNSWRKHCGAQMQLSMHIDMNRRCAQQHMSTFMNSRMGSDLSSAAMRSVSAASLPAAAAATPFCCTMAPCTRTRTGYDAQPVAHQLATHHVTSGCDGHMLFGHMLFYSRRRAPGPLEAAPDSAALWDAAAHLAQAARRRTAGCWSHRHVTSPPTSAQPDQRPRLLLSLCHPVTKSCCQSALIMYSIMYGSCKRML